MRARALSFAVPLLALFLARTALACSVCGCDPAAGTLGLDRPSANFLRISLEDRLLSKESGDADAAESERENRAMLRVQYSPLTRLTLQAELPGFLYHVEVEGVLGALESARRLPTVHDAALFGTSLHVHMSSDDPEQLRRELQAAGVTVHDLQRISPTLEDVFVALIEKHDPASSKAQGAAP